MGWVVCGSMPLITFYTAIAAHSTSSHAPPRNPPPTSLPPLLPTHVSLSEFNLGFLLYQAIVSVTLDDHLFAPFMFTPARMAKLSLQMGNGDPADIYYPVIRHPPSSPLKLPIALLLQGLNVDKRYYSRYAQQVARYGFVVIVPNHHTTIRGREELFAQVGQVTEVLKLAQALQKQPESPLAKLVDPERLVLLGHSHGGMMGLDAIRGACDVPFCVGEYSLPEELKAAVFFGTALWEDGEYLKIDNSQIPIALIAGDRDSLIQYSETRLTYKQIVHPPKAFIVIQGVNHYGITDENNPSGSPLELNNPEVSQEDSITTIARWSGLFLRSHTFGDRRAARAIYQFDPKVHILKDVYVSVESQAKSVR